MKATENATISEGNVRSASFNKASEKRTKINSFNVSVFIRISFERQMLGFT